MARCIPFWLWAPGRVTRRGRVDLLHHHGLIYRQTLIFLQPFTVIDVTGHIDASISSAHEQMV